MTKQNRAITWKTAQCITIQTEIWDSVELEEYVYIYRVP